MLGHASVQVCCEGSLLAPFLRHHPCFMKQRSLNALSVVYQAIYSVISGRKLCCLLCFGSAKGLYHMIHACVRYISSPNCNCCTVHHSCLLKKCLVRVKDVQNSPILTGLSFK